ncbi:hypothetical protein TNCV_4091471 [Trichonephila clavipes]|nr:hypothetical protein TNCV_4091471 [Trichonephila clavipes]
MNLNVKSEVTQEESIELGIRITASAEFMEDHELHHLRDVALAVQCVGNTDRKFAAVESNTTPDHYTVCWTSVAMHNATVH